MRITTRTPARLVIEHRPRSAMTALAALCFVALAIGVDLAMRGSGWAALFLAVGFALALVVHYDFPAHARTTLDRETGLAVIEWLDGAGVTRRHVPLTDIAHARVQIIRSHDGPAITRAALVTPEGPAQITRAFHQPPGAARAVAAINRWLNG